MEYLNQIMIHPVFGQVEVIGIHYYKNRTMLEIKLLNSKDHITLEVSIDDF